jgi:ribonuclease HepT-like protein
VRFVPSLLQSHGLGPVSCVHPPLRERSAPGNSPNARGRRDCTKTIGAVSAHSPNRLPENFRTQHFEIEWRKIIGLRNRIVHDYFNIDIEILWEIIQKDLPDFKSKLSLIRT